jgi:hypothetical protein
MFFDVSRITFQKEITIIIKKEEIDEMTMVTMLANLSAEYFFHFH